MILQDILFYFLAAFSVLGGLSVILMPNPIYSALSLAVTMVSVAGLFFSLDAYFLAGVQLIVYAGAVMVLFVMVIMLFDLKKELDAFSSGIRGALVKVAAVGALLGLVVGGFEITHMTGSPSESAGLGTVRETAVLLFSKHIFAFEIISLLLLVVVVGAVSLARTRGGTHA